MSLSKPLREEVLDHWCKIAYGAKCSTEGCPIFTPPEGGQEPHQTVVHVPTENWGTWVPRCIRCAEKLLRLRLLQQQHSANAQREREERKARRIAKEEEAKEASTLTKAQRKSGGGGGGGTGVSEDPPKGGAGGSGYPPKMINMHGAGGSLATQRRKKAKAKKAKKPQAKDEDKDVFNLPSLMSKDTKWADAVDA